MIIEYPASFSYFGPTKMEVNDACIRCNATGAALEGASMVALSDRWGYRCRACTTVEMDAIALNDLIDRLTRNPALAAKVREVLGVK